MDAAAQTLLKKTAFILAIALVTVSPALAVPTLSVNSQTVTLSTNQPVNVGVTSATGSPVHFTVTNSAGWYSAALSNGSTSGTTQATLIFQVVNTSCQFS